MIFRKWTGRIRTTDADTYIQYIRDTVGDEYAAGEHHEHAVKLGIELA